ncbi:MAG: hypothetical protein AAGA66_04395, partial [Bacteroidota bacterium]
EVASITYNLSALHRDREEFNKAIDLLETCLNIESDDPNIHYQILNRLTFTNYQIKDFEKVYHYANKILSQSDKAGPRYTAYTYHIMGKSAMDLHDFDGAQKHLEKALTIIHSNPDYFYDKKAAFEVIYDMGLNSMKIDDLLAAEAYFHQAEVLISEVKQNPEYFEIYKSQADLYYELEDFQKSRKYENLYSKSLTAYLDTQEEIRATDQRYNMDLITKRYFAEIEKQEQIASILLYSKVISGGLLLLLLAVIGYYRYEKVKLRRSIEKELVALKFID